MSIVYLPHTQGYLDITFGPKWDYIHLTKNYVENFLETNLVDKHHINKITMSASELLENAITYSHKEGVRVKIKKDMDNNIIQLSVYNYTTKEHANYLINYIRDMKNKDPMQYYINKVKESIKYDKGESKLGIPRINYEGQAQDIEVKFFEEEEVVVINVIFNI